MIKTSDLISSLAKDLPPVRRLRPPVVRASCWLVLAAAVLTLLAIAQGLRPDLAQRLNDPAFAVGMIASIQLAFLRRSPLFSSAFPDRSLLASSSNPGSRHLVVEHWLPVPHPVDQHWPRWHRSRGGCPVLCNAGSDEPALVTDDARDVAPCRTPSPQDRNSDGQPVRCGNHGDGAAVSHHGCNRDDPDVESRDSSHSGHSGQRLFKDNVPMGRATHACRIGLKPNGALNRPLSNPSTEGHTYA